MASSYLKALVMDGSRPTILRYLDAMFYLSDGFCFTEGRAEDIVETYPWAASLDLRDHLLTRLDQLKNSGDVERHDELTLNEIQRYRLIVKNCNNGTHLTMMTAQWNIATMIIQLVRATMEFYNQLEALEAQIEELNDISTMVDVSSNSKNSVLLDAADYNVQVELIRGSLNGRCRHRAKLKEISANARTTIHKLLDSAYHKRMHVDANFSPSQYLGIDFDSRKFKDPVFEIAAWTSEMLSLPILDNKAYPLMQEMSESCKQVDRYLEDSAMIGCLKILWSATLDMNTGLTEA